jgi:hypothetical protein
MQGLTNPRNITVPAARSRTTASSSPAAGQAAAMGVRSGGEKSAAGLRISLGARRGQRERWLLFCAVSLSSCMMGWGGGAAASRALNGFFLSQPRPGRHLSSLRFLAVSCFSGQHDHGSYARSLYSFLIIIIMLRRDTRKLLLAWLSRFGVLY